MPRPTASHVRSDGPPLAGLLLTAWVAACGKPTSDARSAEASGTPTPSATSAPAPWVSEFRYGPTFASAVPEGVAAVPVAEVGIPDQGRVRFVAAVVRGGRSPTSEVGLEVWDFDQNNPEQKLRRTGVHDAVFRIDTAAPRAPELLELRRQMATPSSKTRRPLGLDVADPTALLEALAAAARTAGDGRATPDERAAALATFVRGLDDRLVMVGDRSAQLRRDMGEHPWTLDEERKIGERRSEATSTGPGDRVPRQLSFMRRSGGWTLTDVRSSGADQSDSAARDADPAPTLPLR